MLVRYKLDTCGIKLKLDQWSCFDQTDRQELVNRACDSPAEIADYRAFLIDLIRDRAQAEAKTLAIDPNPAWLNLMQIPQSLMEKAARAEANLSLEQWQSLSTLQRFALFKLSRPSHESHNFIPALREFGILEV